MADAARMEDAGAPGCAVAQPCFGAHVHEMLRL